MAVILLIISSSFALETSSPVVFYSASTPEGLLPYFTNFSLKVFVDPSISPDSLMAQIRQNSIFIDITLTQSFLPVFDLIASTTDSYYITLHSEETRTSFKRRIHALNSISSEVNAINKIIEWLKLDNFMLLSSNLNENLKIAKLVFQAQKNSIFSYLTYDQNLDLRAGLTFVQKMIKVKGISQFLIIDQGKSLKIMQKSFINKNINDANVLFLFTSKSVGSLSIDGSILICEEGLAASQSIENYYFLSISKKLDQIEKSFKDISKESRYSILVYYEGLFSELGWVDLNITFNYSVTTPVRSPIKAKELVILFANGTNEIGNSHSYSIFSYFYNGAIFAVNKINNENLIPRFKISLRTTDTGIYAYDSNWYQYKLSQVLFKPSPFAYITGFWPSATYGNLMTLRQMSYFLPQISPYSPSILLENTTVFPELVKLTEKFSDIIVNMLIPFFSFNWNSVIMITSNEDTYYDIYLSALEICKQRGINVINPEKSRVFPWNYTRDNFEEYKAYFSAIKETRCRIFLILATCSGYIFEGLYDIGLRKGDAMITTDDTLLGVLEEDIPSIYMNKRKEIALGSFVIRIKEWNGKTGEQLFKELSKVYPQVQYFCMCYDTVTVIKGTLEFMLLRGEDYDNSREFINHMRGFKGNGCMGTLYFAQGSNNIGYAKYLVVQVLENEKGVYTNTILILDKLSSVIAQSIEKIVWINDSLPSNFLPSSGCPFEIRDITRSFKTKIILVCFSLFFFILTVVTSYFSWKVFRSSYCEIGGTREMSFSDRAFYAYFFFQFLQILNMGPDQDIFRALFTYFYYMVSIDLDRLYNLQKGDYWVMFFNVFGFAVFLTILSFAIVFKLDIAYQHRFVFNKILILSDFIIPFISTITFLPVFSMLMNFFLCSQAIGDSLYDSFMDRDCYTFCYKGIHSVMAVVNLVVIFLFLVLGTFTKPLWELRQSSLSIRTKPAYLSALSVFQVVLVVLNKTVKIESQFVHGIVCSAFILAFAGFTGWYRPYNYPRAFIWQISSLFLAFWGVVVQTVLKEIGNSMSLAITEFSGFAVILVVAIIWHSRESSVLVVSKGKDISSLFIFQFCKDFERYAVDLGTLDFTGKGNKYEIKVPSE